MKRLEEWNWGLKVAEKVYSFDFELCGTKARLNTE